MQDTSGSLTNKITEMKKFIKKLLGLDILESEIELSRVRQQAEFDLQKEELTSIIEKIEKEKQQIEEEKAKLAEVKKTPKELATEQGQPWVDVLEVKVNPDNPRAGFFELDWNDLFVSQLIEEGYGTTADKPEEIVDRWFRTLAYQMYADEGIDPSRGYAGFINVTPISNNRSEVK